MPFYLWKTNCATQTENAVIIAPIKNALLKPNNSCTGLAIQNDSNALMIPAITPDVSASPSFIFFSCLIFDLLSMRSEISADLIVVMGKYYLRFLLVCSGTKVPSFFT